MYAASPTFTDQSFLTIVINGRICNVPVYHDERDIPHRLATESRHVSRKVDGKMRDYRIFTCGICGGTYAVASTIL